MKKKSPYKELYKLLAAQTSGKNVPLSTIEEILFLSPLNLFGSGFDSEAIAKDMASLGLIRFQGGLITLI